jgi:hypothetical protein
MRLWSHLRVKSKHVKILQVEYNGGSGEKGKE